MKVAGFLVVFLVSLARGQGPLVTLPGLGTLEGFTGGSFISDRLFYRFRGIPFAKPPVGNLRFKPPQPVEPWTGILDAHSSFGNGCPQGSGGRTWQGVLENYVENDFNKALEPEDCLYIQVYSPNIDPTANLPVVVFIHGGAFNTGSSRLYGGNKFMDHDVVLVVPHYRLGPLGFFSLHTDEIPGNAGMLDQVEALKWVQKYISYFGGNPNKVTVMGESAGGVSTSLLNLSPLSTNLFQQYITQSGTALTTWGIDPDPIRSATEIAFLANCTNPEINALTQCLMTVEPSVISGAYMDYLTYEVKQGRSGIGGSAPVVQRAGSVKFLEKSPKEIFRSGEYNAKPAIFGANKHEGTMPYFYMHAYYMKPNNLIDDVEFLSRGVTRLFFGFLGVFTDQGDTLALATENTYLGAQNMGNLNLITPGLIDLSSNMYIKGSTIENAEFNAAKGAPTYLYSFHFDGSRSLYPLFAPFSPIPGGVCHGNEMILQFSIPTYGTNAQDDVVSNQMLTLWANFIKYGDPTPVSSPVEGIPTWPRLENRDGSYLVINSTSSILQDYTRVEYFVSIDENFPNNV
ncbi:bile salt-activated lipase-like [Neocloeon triangulifer]|uniref:bile salt-activated lipase-like n=1 Tax=Neocloeon triangulifer TaxID=2078957 RepID=UPI00286F4528|nr:bile salt-activated lipase-like [Neocloeon triangulifer]